MEPKEASYTLLFANGQSYTVQPPNRLDEVPFIKTMRRLKSSSTDVNLTNFTKSVFEQYRLILEESEDIARNWKGSEYTSLYVFIDFLRDELTLQKVVAKAAKQFQFQMIEDKASQSNTEFFEFWNFVYSYKISSVSNNEWRSFVKQSSSKLPKTVGILLQQFSENTSTLDANALFKLASFYLCNRYSLRALHRDWDEIKQILEGLYEDKDKQQWIICLVHLARACLQNEIKRQDMNVDIQGDIFPENRAVQWLNWGYQQTMPRPIQDTVLANQVLFLLNDYKKVTTYFINWAKENLSSEGFGRAASLESELQVSLKYTWNVLRIKNGNRTITDHVDGHRRRCVEQNFYLATMTGLFFAYVGLMSNLFGVSLFDYEKSVFIFLPLLIPTVLSVHSIDDSFSRLCFGSFALFVLIIKVIETFQACTYPINEAVDKLKTTADSSEWWQLAHEIGHAKKFCSTFFVIQPFILAAAGLCLLNYDRGEDFRNAQHQERGLFTRKIVEFSEGAASRYLKWSVKYPKH